MLINFYAKADGPEFDLYQAYRDGSPHDVRLISDGIPRVDGDVDALIGCKSVHLRQQLRDYRRPWLMFDKGYNRDWPRWWRMVKNAHLPTDYLMSMDCPPDRAEAQGWQFNGWCDRSTRDVLIAGASDKAHKFFGIEPANDWAQNVIQQIKGHRILYRPKPTFKEAHPLPGAGFSQGRCSIKQDLQRVSVMITYASVAALDALLAGVPTIVLGSAITRPISSVHLGQIDNPFKASAEQCNKLLHNLAYTQWTIDEYRSGVAQKHMGDLI